MPHLIARRHVGVIAIGNAVANAFVANRIDAEQMRLKLAQGGATITQNTSKAVNAALDAQFATEQAQRDAVIDNDNNTRLQQQALNTVTDLQKIQDSENAKEKKGAEPEACQPFPFPLRGC